ncbi:hypothetical protein DL89DRAFT_134724 [Linderina pennispora]|uniref:Uncharacterized protein n=1 Tax=Linderina pennispora TaxID=61395 RepID=A0A1Y1WBF5_9FUNG|nr:uncharacterized protein DL89DRAFT_134724 [Linderina pennispora]ORX70484.1 hypothetical protein DL89DRAFT_134724 [Linderina pennispora]
MPAMRPTHTKNAMSQQMHPGNIPGLLSCVLALDELPLAYYHQQRSFESSTSSPGSSEADNSAGTSTVISDGSAELLKAPGWANVVRGLPGSKAAYRGSMHIPFSTASTGAALPAPLQEHAKRASRYLYDVPNIQQPRRISRASRSLLDQHKIYDIYEESLWHSANIARPMTATAHPGFPNADDVERQRKAHPASPWNLIRSLKFQNTERKPKSGWEDSCSLFSQHTTSDHANEKSSTRLHELVRRAGLGILRRSVSFCKTISGSRLHAGDHPAIAAGESPVPPRTARKHSGLLANHAAHSQGQDPRRSQQKAHADPRESRFTGPGRPARSYWWPRSCSRPLATILTASQASQLLDSPVMAAPTNSGASSSNSSSNTVGDDRP